jgi:hypothetical protein
MGRAAASCDCQALRKKSISASRESRQPRSENGRLVRFVEVPYKKRWVASQGRRNEAEELRRPGGAMGPGLLHLSPLPVTSCPQVTVPKKTSCRNSRQRHDYNRPAGRGIPAPQTGPEDVLESSRCSRKLTSKKRPPLGVPHCGTLFRIERRTECGRWLSSRVQFRGPESLTL